MDKENNVRKNKIPCSQCNEELNSDTDYNGKKSFA